MQPGTDSRKQKQNSENAKLRKKIDLSMDFAGWVVNMEKKETMIQAEDLVYEYRKYDEEGRERELIKASASR